MTSSYRDLIKRVSITFFIVMGCTVLFTYVFAIFAEIEAILISDIDAIIVMSLLNSITHLILFSKKKLNFKQALRRYLVVFILIVFFTLTVIIYMEWFEINIFSVLAVVFVVAAVFTYILGILLAQTRLETIAYADHLTGAYNRRYFMKTAASMLKTCIKENKEFAIITLDLDHFKAINDTHGHSVGDEVLTITVARISHSLASGTLLARFGGEEFVLMITDAKKEDLLSMAWRIQRSLTSSPYKIGDLSLRVTASFGIASKSDYATTLKEIIANSDIALYQAKKEGRNTVVYHEPAI